MLQSNLPGMCHVYFFFITRPVQITHRENPSDLFVIIFTATVASSRPLRVHLQQRPKENSSMQTSADQVDRLVQFWSSSGPVLVLTVSLCLDALCDYNTAVNE